MTWSDGQVRMLARGDYKNLWGNISTRFLEHAACFRNSIVTGTSGIGKSVFRWYLVWMWLNHDPSIAKLHFNDVRVNIGETFYLIEKDGTASEIVANILSINASGSLALIDPCPFVQNRKIFPFKMTVITSSLSHVVGQVGKYSLTECSKLAIIYVMALWTLSELKLIMPHICPRRLKQFGLNIGLTTYCVPRWFTYTELAIPGFISRSWTHVSKDALRDYFLKETDDEYKNKYFPYGLCIIEENGYNDWKVSGFISAFIAEEVYKWAKIASHLDRGLFVNLFNHPLGGGLIGTWYERWALECLELQTAIVIANSQLNNGIVNVPSKGEALTFSRFRFESLSIVDLKVTTKGKPIYDVALEPGVLYKPRLKCNPSIDAFGIIKPDKQPGDLILLQFTKALTHSSAFMDDLGRILRLARAKSPQIRVLLVYCTPIVEKFKLPNCETLYGSGIVVCKGAIDKDFYVELTKAN
uniref:Uncharacterized protein n=2 Tax=Cryptomonas curvata TaxID=233186 RepID=A0A7S0MLM3_9CRYP|mmetsp:Transcript_47452/g.99245  ORF Transcript_47452/g.99245 Transcript_47452/m.99245 type:complete len:470 (+) Transcript_47452:399-1808(+)